MVFETLGDEARDSAQEILGYLNYSSGKADPRFLQNVNALYALLLARRANASIAEELPVWQELGGVLREAASALRGTSEAFRQLDQAEAVLRLVFDELPLAYRRHHADLLFHQTDEFLFQPYFLGRLCEAVLRQGGPWDERDRISGGALAQVNNFIGHRPVAVLRNERKLQPYAHEWVAPVPVYVRGAGVSAGPYYELLTQALAILRQTHPDLLFQAWFSLENLDEIAIDPRAYDFDHPANKRPNYHFGTWDPHAFDQTSNYRRFVLQQVTLDGILLRVLQQGEGISREELLFEAAAVLAGTMLMASGISGSRPDSHDSSVTLGKLLPLVAGYRDAFYEGLIAQVEGAHAKRLRREAKTLRQPFGGARQHLNQQLARARAMQLQHVHLAHLFGRMGFTAAAMRQATIVPVASARIECQILCRLTAAHQAIDQGRLADAAAELPVVEDLLHRGIECGAMIDPWNILGFGAQFSLFPALENSVHDYRADELIDLVNEIFNLYARLQKQAAAAGDRQLPAQLAADMVKLADWWDQFATIEVSAVVGFSGHDSAQAAKLVSDALWAWQEAGVASGDVAFWRDHVSEFQSAEAFALVVESLLEQRDPVASLALLVQWLSQSDEIPLVDPSYSFHDLTVDWMEDVLGLPGDTARTRPPLDLSEEQRWNLARRFFDYIEANADEYWEVPRLELTANRQRTTGDEDDGDEEPDDGSDGLFAAAYEDVVYRDTTADGVEGEIVEGGESINEFELSHEAERISDRLAFLLTLARLWKMTAATFGVAADARADRDEILALWLGRTRRNQQKLSELLMSVHRYRIRPPRSSQESLVEFDQHRAIKESLLERILATSVETADAARLIRAAMRHGEPGADDDAWEEPALRVVRCMFRGDAGGVRLAFPELLGTLQDQPLLYVALGKGGNPQRILASRSIQRVLRRLLAHLPRLGLLVETFQLLETIQDMERNHAVGPGAITEFDQMFEIGCKSIVQCLVASSKHWAHFGAGKAAGGNGSDVQLINCLERAIEALLRCWLEHSRRVRLSVLEAVADEHRWQPLKRFIQQHGHDLFTQHFMNIGNLRAILHQGVGAWLQWLGEEPDAEGPQALLARLATPAQREEAASLLDIAMEAVVENYSEYMDYNSTTTQSDRGEMLYTLLDFLRLRASYDRVAWNLRPIMLAHEVLVRQEREDAAEIWRQAVAQRTATIADDLLERFAALCKQYGMRLPTIADRLEERFIRPLAIDRLRALIHPAVEELRLGQETPSFEALEREIADFTEEPTGVGFEVPFWLESLEEELEQIKFPSIEDDQPLDLHLGIPQVALSLQEAERQVKRMLKGARA